MVNKGHNLVKSSLMYKFIVSVIEINLREV